MNLSRKRERSYAFTIEYDFMCAVDGGWTDWGHWSTCSTTCESGTKTRLRSCTNPAPANGGLQCVGNTTEYMTCNLGTCPGKFTHHVQIRKDSSEKMGKAFKSWRICIPPLIARR